LRLTNPFQCLLRRSEPVISERAVLLACLLASAALAGDAPAAAPRALPITDEAKILNERLRALLQSRPASEDEARDLSGQLASLGAEAIPSMLRTLELGSIGPGLTLEKLEGEGGHADQSSRVHAVVALATPADLTAFGRASVDKEAARDSTPSAATELMVAYAYDTIQRVNPIGFFGMVHVLEGTSITIADRAADAIGDALGLPAKAFSYLRSHGALDQEHVKFFEDLMDRITDAEEQALIIHSARVFYQLYANIFRTLPTEMARAA